MHLCFCAHFPNFYSKLQNRIRQNSFTGGRCFIDTDHTLWIQAEPKCSAEVFRCRKEFLLRYQSYIMVDHNSMWLYFLMYAQASVEFWVQFSCQCWPKDLGHFPCTKVPIGNPCLWHEKQLPTFFSHMELLVSQLYECCLYNCSISVPVPFCHMQHAGVGIISFMGLIRGMSMNYVKASRKEYLPWWTYQL